MHLFRIGIVHLFLLLNLTVVSFAGMPQTDRTWRGSDYLAASESITKGETPLPLLSDADGRKQLERITHTGSLAYYQDKSTDIGERLDDFTRLQQGLAIILFAYIQDANQKESSHAHTEMIHLMACCLRVASAGVTLVNEFVPTIPKDDKYEVRMNGLKRMHAGVMTTFSGAVTTLSETDSFTPSDLALLLAAMHENLPTMSQTFTPEFKKHCVESLKALRFNGKEGDLVKAMITSLEGRLS